MTDQEAARRYGLVGTGHWADTVHAPALARRDDAAFVGVWGRDARRTTAIAERHGLRVYDRPADLFAAVDVVCFAVPPDVQAPLAVEAARAGCHLLLEKPLALGLPGADALVDATRDRVATVVFFTSRFVPSVADWIAELRRIGGWQAMPDEPADATTALGRALDELVDAATAGGAHPCDASFGREVVRVLADAEASMIPPGRAGASVVP